MPKTSELQRFAVSKSEESHENTLVYICLPLENKNSTQGNRSNLFDRQTREKGYKGITQCLCNTISPPK